LSELDLNQTELADRCALAAEDLFSDDRNKVNTPLEFCIYAPEGVAITEYQLLRLRDQKEYRELRTVTGGVLHCERRGHFMSVSGSAFRVQG
jgi:hypothetical protein